MKMLCSVLFVGVLGCFLAGCAGTSSIVTEYDAASGAVTKRIESRESLVKEVTASTANKTVIVWENGWAAYLAASTATTDDPTPTVKMWAGKSAKGVISALPTQQNWDGIAKTISATKEDLNVSASGIAGTSETEASQMK